MATGHVRKRGNSWTYVLYVIDASSGESKPRWKGGFRTQAAAQKALRKAITAYDHGVAVEPSKMTYREYITDIWIPGLSDQIEESTQESYERNLRVHILPRIGGIAVQGLAPTHLNGLYRDLLATNVAAPQSANRSHDPRIYDRIADLREDNLTYKQIALKIAEELPDEPPLTRHSVARIIARSKEQRKDSPRLSITTVRYISTIISGSLRDAIKLGLLTENVVAKSSPPRKPRRRPKKVLWTTAETRQFLQWVFDIEHRLAPAWAFVATSADRRGGNLGLRWQDVDLEAGRAEMSWTVTCVDHRIVVKAYPKSGDDHEIMLDQGTIAVLKSWKVQQNKERLLIGQSHVCESWKPGCKEPGFHDRDLVFARPDGDYLHPERFSREFTRTQARHNRANPKKELVRISLHALRHGWATAALEAGVPMKVVQDRLNHASERITSDIYTHVRAPMQSDAAEQVGSQLLPTQKRAAAPRRKKRAQE